MNKKIKFIYPELSLEKDVAIVGSSGSLLKNTNGGLIDSFSEVVRFNRAPVKEYEKFVGAKTTLRVVNNHVFDNVDISDQGFTNQPKKFVKKLRKSNILFIGPDIQPWNRRKKNTHKSNTLYKFEYKYSEELKKIFNLNSSEYLQVGTIFTLLCVLSEIKPVLFGFDLEPIKRTHYFEERPDRKDEGWHKISIEMKKLYELNQEGTIKVL